MIEDVITNAIQRAITYHIEAEIDRIREDILKTAATKAALEVSKLVRMYRMSDMGGDKLIIEIRTNNDQNQK